MNQAIHSEPAIAFIGVSGLYQTKLLLARMLSEDSC